MEVVKNNNSPSFNRFSIAEKGQPFWLASWYASVLKYKSLKTLEPTIKKAIATCRQIDIPVDKNFILFEEHKKKDYKLSKFACFLISIHADGRKEIVKKARAYFLNELEEMHLSINEENFLKRNLSRNLLKELNKDFMRIARKSHVKDFQYFTNEGYLGLYNNTAKELRNLKEIANKKNISDYMGETELIANLFRIKLTEERLKVMRNPSELKAAKTHWEVGARIRSLIKSNTGLYPEELKKRTNLLEFQRKLQKAQKQLNDEIKSIDGQGN